MKAKVCIRSIGGRKTFYRSAVAFGAPGRYVCKQSEEKSFVAISAIREMVHMV